jgi:hypothetical protein
LPVAYLEEHRALDHLVGIGVEVDGVAGLADIEGEPIEFGSCYSVR